MAHTGYVYEEGDDAEDRIILPNNIYSKTVSQTLDDGSTENVIDKRVKKPSDMTGVTTNPCTQVEMNAFADILITKIEALHPGKTFSKTIEEA